MVTPMIVGGLILRFTFERGVGVVNALFRLLGFEQLTRTWTAFPDTALFALIFGSVWLWTGFSMILYSAGLATIPKDYYEAAKIDGTTRFRTFYRITLPLLKPITLTVITMTILWELKIFDIVYVATLGGPGGASNVLALLMYNIAFRAFDFNSAAVVATFLTLLTLLVITAVAIVRTRNLFVAVMLSGMFSLLIAVIFFLLDAADVATVTVTVASLNSTHHSRISSKRGATQPPHWGRVSATLFWLRFRQQSYRCSWLPLQATGSRGSASQFETISS